MADDDKGAKPDDAAHPASPSAGTASVSAAGSPEIASRSPAANTESRSSATPRPSTDEWTASDSRGPLETAEGGYAASIEPSPGEPLQEGHATEARTAPPNDPAAEPAQDAPVATPPAPEMAAAGGRSPWPIAAALVVGALIGAGSAALVSHTSENGASAADVARLGARVDALEKRPDPQAALDALSRKVAAAQQRPAPAPARSPAPDPEVAAKLAALQASVDALKSQSGSADGLEAKVSALEGAVAGMKSAAATTQAGVASVEGQQKTLSDKVMVPALAVVADSLVQQIDRGEPYGAQVDALVSLGADPAKVAVLRENAAKGVPSAKDLAAKFEPLAGPIAAASPKAAKSSGFVDRLKSGMMSMVSVRRADDTSGDDLPSRVARIRADLAHDDVAGALATWNALPAEARAHGGDGWAVLAKTTVAARVAARDLQHDAIVALGAKRS